jgi:predicted ATPase
MPQNKLIVISGCSGGGKSTLLAELNNNGYATIAEVGREIVKEQIASNGSITPWDNPQAFCEVNIERAIAGFHKAQAMMDVKGQVIFFDRGYLDGVCYYQTLRMTDAQKYNHFINGLRYDPMVFMAPPWQAIFCQDDERKHSFEDAVIEYQRLLKFYTQSGYHIVELPRQSVKQRLQFVITKACLV